MKGDIPKALRRQMNQLVDTAHELALRGELTKLDQQFARWRGGEIDSFALAELIHKFHDGPNRETYIRFSDRRGSRLASIAAYAIHNGLVGENAVSPEVMEFVARRLEFYRYEST